MFCVDSTGRQIQLVVFTLPWTPPCVVTQAKDGPRNQTVELLWRSAAIIPQAPSLFYAWISAPESTNRWLLVLCAHEWHVRAAKWYLSVSGEMAACGSLYRDAYPRLWVCHELFWKSSLLTYIQNYPMQEELVDMFEKSCIILYSGTTLVVSVDRSLKVVRKFIVPHLQFIVCPVKLRS